MHRRDPDAELAPYVASLVAYDVVSEPGIHIGMPSTRVTLVLPVEEPLVVGWAGATGATPSAGTGRYGTLVAGLHPAPAQIHHGARQRGVHLDLTVAGARALLGMPAGALANVLVDAGDLDPGLRDLPGRLAETERPHWGSLVAATLVDALVRHDAAGPRAEVGRALARLTGGRGVAEVADEVGFSRRHLSDLVRSEVGVSPQQFRRLARFERSQRLVRDGGRLAQLAADCGYADQSHLTREWVALAGCSPTEWRRRELPSVQDPGAPSPPG